MDSSSGWGLKNITVLFWGNCMVELYQKVRISTMIKQRDTYKFCTNCRTELVPREGYKICPSCQKHYFFNAKPCVALILTNSKNEVLLTKRAFEPFKDWWDLPGGFVEEDETLEQAAQREVKEETNLEIKDPQYAGSMSEDYHFQGEIISVVVAIFTAKVPDDAEVTITDELSDYAFVAWADIDFESIAFDNQREFLKNTPIPTFGRSISVIQQFSF